MRKLCLILLALLMLVTVSACGEPDPTTAPTAAPTTAPTAAPTAAPTPPITTPTAPTEPPHSHSYTQAVTAPTCTEKGFTTYTCACGDSYTADPVAATGHRYTDAITAAPTCSTEGIKTYACICGDSYTEAIAKLPHSYGQAITAPTCTEKGFTAYACVCGDGYIDEEVDALGHADGNSDLSCDRCGSLVLVELDIYAINDLHGRFDDSDNQPGLDELSTYLESLNDSTTVLLASGDMWQGTAKSNLTYGAMMTEWMNEMDFAAMTLGNHEFDWGSSYIAANEALAQFPFLAINIYDRTTNTLADYCQSSLLIERSGVTIGIIGAIGDCYSSIAADHRQDVYFKTGSALTALVKAEALRLREAGADIIIYSIHDGGTASQNSMQEYYDVSLSNGYVDLVFEAHTHSSYTIVDQYGVYHIQGGAENRGISLADITYNLVTGEIEVAASVIPSSVYKTYASHPIIEQLLAKYDSQISKGDTLLGYNDSILDGNALRQLVAELYYQAGVERWGAEYDIVLGGGYLSIRNPYQLAAGYVKYDDLYSLFPFDNQLVLCSVKGSDLISRFLQTSNQDYFIYPQSSEAINPNGTYYIVVDAYSSTYGPNRLTEIERSGEAVYARDLLADYIADGHLGRDPLSGEHTLTDIPSLLQLCGQLAPGSISEAFYYVKGQVASIDNHTYGNMYIEDENGNQLYIYGVRSPDGSRYDGMANPPQVGDTITLYGQLKHYVSNSGSVTLEMFETILIAAE